MKSKPIIMDSFHTVHTSFEVDFIFENNITLLLGDSGTGKSAVFSFVRETMVEDARIVCINYLDVNSDIPHLLRQACGKLLVIDNADILLTDEDRKRIAFDKENQYLIIGRNPANLMATEENFYELASEKRGDRTRFYLKRYL